MNTEKIAKVLQSLGKLTYGNRTVRKVSPLAFAVETHNGGWVTEYIEFFSLAEAVEYAKVVK